MHLVKFTCVALLVLVVSSSSLVKSFTITIELKPSQNYSDPELIDLLSKITNVNATAIAHSLDKRIIQIDSLLVNNETINLNQNKIVVESKGDLLKRLIELAPLVNNVINSKKEKGDLNRSTTTTTITETATTTIMMTTTTTSIQSSATSVTTTSTTLVGKLLKQFLPEYEWGQSSEAMSTEHMSTAFVEDFPTTHFHTEQNEETSYATTEHSGEHITHEPSQHENENEHEHDNKQEKPNKEKDQEEEHNEDFDRPFDYDNDYDSKTTTKRTTKTTKSGRFTTTTMTPITHRGRSSSSSSSWWPHTTTSTRRTTSTQSRFRTTTTTTTWRRLTTTTTTRRVSSSTWSTRSRASSSSPSTSSWQFSSSRIHNSTSRWTQWSQTTKSSTTTPKSGRINNRTSPRISSRTFQTTTMTRKTTTTTPFPKIKCPSVFKNFCVNSAECYFKSRTDIEIGDDPLCECIKPTKVTYGLLMRSFSGARCEVITYSFTYLGYGLAISLCVLIVCLMITLCGFICGRDTEKANKNASKSSSSSDKNEKSLEAKCHSNDSWRFVKTDPNSRNRNEFYIKRFRGVNSNGRRTVQKYIEKHTRNILKSIEGLMASSGASAANGSDHANVTRTQFDLNLNENFIFVNRCFRDDSNDSNNNNNSNGGQLYSFDPHSHLDAHCASNIGVYPKPMRSSNPDNNVFNSRCGHNEQTAVNGSLYY